MVWWDDTVWFYSIKDEEHGYLSNFAHYPIDLDDRTWPTTEHYFQAQKFAGTTHEHEIRKAPTPGAAARMGRSRKRPLRKDWEEVKEEVMRKALLAKFHQHGDIREKLLSTGCAKLVEHTTNDSYWADGGDGSGLNRLGELLMELRAQLQTEQEEH